MKKRGENFLDGEGGKSVNAQVGAPILKHISSISMHIRWVNVTPIFDKYEQNNP